MKTIAYCSPYVPPEWIAAHGMGPSWLRLHRAEGGACACGPAVGLQRGVCPFASSVVDAVLAEREASAVVLTTTCDQIRHAAALLHMMPRRRSGCGSLPVFLMNVPATWQTPAARQLYLDELERLGQFLVRLGGRAPTADDLARAMLQFDLARRQLRAARPRLSARGFAEAVAGLRSVVEDSGLGKSECRMQNAASPNPKSETRNPKSQIPNPKSEIAGPSPPPPRDGVPLALVGGPLTEEDFEIFDLIEQAGGRVVLDATEGGERTLPRPLDAERTRRDPLDELADAYSLSIPDVFRRPNDLLYEWLRRELAVRQVRGILFRRYLWCDLWHAELHRLKQFSPLPVLELDVVSDDGSSRSRTLGRLEAFLEMLT
jgi:benzoyl-CoA reductase/2-hydroxyglutaryl-CoA dehydratase subunit BcrC/BadD/HgdB